MHGTGAGTETKPFEVSTDFGPFAAPGIHCSNVRLHQLFAFSHLCDMLQDMYFLGENGHHFEPKKH